MCHRFCLLFCSQGDHRVLPGCHARREKSREHGENYADYYQRHSSVEREYGLKGRNLGEIYEDFVNRYQKEQAGSYSHQSRAESDDQSLGIEDAGYISLGSTYRSEYTYLSGTFQNGYVCYYPYHYGRDYQRYGYEGYEHIAYGIGDGLD